MAGPRFPRWLVPAGVAGVVAVALVVSRLGGEPSSGAPAPSNSPSRLPGVPTGAAPAHSSDLVVGGFARSEAGAVAAATSYLATIAELIDASPGERQTTLTRIAAPDAPTVVSDALQGLDIVDASVADARTVLPTARVLIRDAPLAYQVVGFTPDRARVGVWSVGIVLVEGRTDATEVWSTSTIELVWIEGDWRVSSWSRSPGPTPAAASTATTPPSVLLDTVDGWGSYGHVPTA
jgi:hypothetical protein